MKIPHLRALALLATLILQPAAQAGPLQDHPGNWLGDLTLPNGRVLKIGASFFTRADGSAWASIVSPDQLVYDVPVKAIQAEPGDAIVLDADSARLKLTWVQDHFKGEWRQGENVLPMELRQVASFPRRSRPQTPHPPFPYKEKTLAIASRDGVTLGATLTIPSAPARPNVVVLVAGSGPQSRHADDEGHREFDVLADYLARQGVAVLRYDKRGVARSTGDYYAHTLADLENDLQAVVEALAARHEFGRIGIVGHSEGSQIAAAVAAREPGPVGFVVSMAGVGVSFFDLELMQDRQWAKDNGARPQEVERLMPYVRKYYETVLATPDGAPRIAALKAVYAALSPQDQGLVTKYRMNVVSLSPDFAANPGLRIELASNPQADWRKVRCPVLVLNGSVDHQVPAEENVAGILGALKEGGNTRVQSAVLPSLNHMFQTAHTGGPDEYTKIDETMAPIALERIAAFARKQP
jgi:pimeloyl-ACP methyl ester carboxylesterase